MNLNDLINILDNGERLIVKNSKRKIIFEGTINADTKQSIIDLLLSSASEEDDFSIESMRVAGGAISVTLNNYKD